MPLSTRPSRRKVLAGAAVLVLIAGLVTWAVLPDRAAWTTSDQMIAVPEAPGGAGTIDLDTRLYLPRDRDGRVPAVLLAHGFGGTKNSVRTDAESLVERGYAVLTWTARGFGRSGGQIHLDSPDYEVRDGQRLLDWLADRPEVRTDAAGDPRVGVVGGSYGGALALLLAAQDRRVDAIVPLITWNDLGRSFLPQSADTDATGVFKKGWAGLFFGNGAASPAEASDGTEDQQQPPQTLPPGINPACGRFAADVCAAYLSMATTGIPDEAALAVLRKSSPAPVLGNIKAPTLLIQGAVDTLFPLSEADANARGIASAGTPVRVAWFTGGHDGGLGPQTDQDRTKFLTAQWLDHYVKGEGAAPADSFTYSRVAGFSALDRGLVTNGYSVDAYPGISGTGRTDVSVTGPAQPIANPPNGNPGALSSLPGVGGRLSTLLEGVAGDIPGQYATFESEPVARSVDVVGAPTVRLRAASPTGEATLFVKLYDVASPRLGSSATSDGPGAGGSAAGSETLSAGLVAPVRLTGLPADIGQAQPVTVTLPAIVRRIEAGNTLRIVVSTSDQGYLTPAQPATYTVAVEPTLTLPTMVGTPISNPQVIWRYVLAGLLAAILLGLVVVLLVRRRRAARAPTVDEFADTPLVVRDLRKEYADGFVAVEEISFTVERGQVVGLLGPNGAGKTTTLRVLMGLTLPTRGDALVFGNPLVPGAPILSRVGSLVEGPGFLPHLTGEQNLRAYWQATGRPWADAKFDEAVAIAGLGDSIHRRTKNYSHGMRQRLAIAQAMLGMPDLLVLDEPTDGLDPPQIAEMRRVLQRYATDGRAVLVSSHLLAEVEQTCTHAVVVHKGRIVASGPVEDIVGESPSVQIEVTDVAQAERVLAGLDVASVLPDGATGLIVDMNGTARSAVVAALVGAGVGVDRVVPRRRLEDAFLALVGENSRGSGDR